MLKILKRSLATKSGKRNNKQQFMDTLMEELEPRVLLSADLAGGFDDCNNDCEPVAPVHEVMLDAETELANDIAAEIQSRELVIIDSGTTDYQQFVDDIRANNDSEVSFDIAILDADADGVSQISNLLGQYSDLSAVHIISHGEAGSIFLGDTTLDLDAALSNASELREWGDALTETGDVMIYGCNLAADANGQTLISVLSNLTGADVAASDDLTGSASLGGDWDLEYEVGVVDADVAVSADLQANYSAVLAETLYVDNDTASTPNDYELQSDQNLGQTFRDSGPGGSYDVDFIELQLYREAAATSQTLTVELRDSWDGTVLASVSINTDDLATSSNWERFSFSDVTLDNGQSYTIRVSTDSTDGGIWIESDDSNSYNQGRLVDKDGNTQNQEDVLFRVGLSNQAPVITSNGGGDTANVSVNENQTAVTTVTFTDVDDPSVDFNLVGGADQALFSIDASGVLTFNAAPDFETPGDANGDGVYEVIVEVDDNYGGTDTQTIYVTVADANDAPVITSNGGGDSANVNAAENQTAVTTVTYTDQDVPADSVDFNLVGGADQALFSISAGGVLTFNTAPDFETPTDANADGIYEVIVEVDDNNGGTDTQTIYVTVADANDAPVITSNGGGDTANLNVNENQTAVTTVTYTDQDVPADSVDFNLVGGADQALFSISAGGVLTFNAAPDFETPGDANGDGIYEVIVAVDDNNGGTDTQTIYVTINDIPVISSNGGGDTANVNAAENQTAVTTVTYTDLNVPADSVDFNLVGGTDQALFSIDASGVLTFNTAPDFETPTDANGDGIYEVIVEVDDNNGGTDTQTIYVTVTDVNDVPVISSNGGGDTANVNAAENQTAVTTVTYTDADVPADSVDFNLVGGADQALFSIDASGVLTFNTAPDFETPTDANGDGIYEVIVEVDDNNGGTDTQTIYVTVTDVNDVPVISSNGGGDTANVNVAENQTAVTTVTYTDADVPADSVDFNLVGGADQALFSIDASGVLTFNAAPDFETPGDANGDGIYEVIVEVDDNNGGTDTQTIYVTVTDVNDVPVISSDGGGDTANVNVAENQTAVTTVTYTDADVPADSVDFNLVGGADQALFSIDASGVLTFNAAPDFETPGDANGDGIYEVIVEVDDNNGGTDTQTIYVTVTDANDVPVISSDGGGDTANVNAAENQTAVTTVTYTDADVPADSVDFNLVGGADGALFSIDASGVLTFSVAPDFAAPGDADGDNVYEVLVQVDDNNGGTDTQLISVTVTFVNGAPDANSDSYAVDEDNNLVANAGNGLLFNDVDNDGLGGMQVIGMPVTDPANGTVTLNSDGTFTYTPDQDFNGSDSFAYEITDANGDTAQANVTITVNSVNDAPNADSDLLNAEEGKAMIGSIGELLQNDTDVDLDTLTLVSFTAPANGILVDNGDGTFLYEPAVGFFGQDSFSYTIEDPSGEQATATVIINVTPAPPVNPGDDENPPTDDDDTDEGTDNETDEGADDESVGGGGGASDGDPAPEEEDPSDETEGSPTATSTEPQESPDNVGAVVSINEGDDDNSQDDDEASVGTQVRTLFSNLQQTGSGFEFQSFGFEQIVLSQTELSDAIEMMKRELDDGNGQGSDAVVVAKIATGTGIALSMGFLGWVLQGGAMAASLLSVMPVWANFDPLPLLAGRKKKKTDPDDTASNLNSMFDESAGDES